MNHMHCCSDLATLQVNASAIVATAISYIQSILCICPSLLFYSDLKETWSPFLGGTGENMMQEYHVSFHWFII